MKKAMAVVFALMVLSAVGHTAVSAQTPYVAVYFDQTLTSESLSAPVCPGFGVVDTLYVAALNWNMFVVGLEYSVSYGANLNWLLDFDKPAVAIGTSPTGISVAWGIPQNGFFAINVHKVLVQWVCNDCTAANSPIVVGPAPFNAFGKVQATSWPDALLFDGIGLTGLTCATVPTEETTWGQVKALYGE